MITYDEYIDSKTKVMAPVGFTPMPIKAPLFDWQTYIVRWAIRQGRAALFEDCGCGKTLQQLEWARQVANHTKQPVIILTPLAVAQQTAEEATKFGIKAKVVSDASQVIQGINITNYEKLEHFDPSVFGGVVLDESSILKNFTGKTRIALTESFSRTPYRLCCTATPSPNDYTEFGQHAAFLGICSPAQMLATFFVNDTFNTGDWRLKGHAQGEFWKWLASWAACLSKPSDIGFDDTGYNLPALHMKSEIVHVDETVGAGDELFRHSTLSATTMHKELRMTSEARALHVAELVNSNKEPWLVWCNTNDEADWLVKYLPESIEVRGSDPAIKKEKVASWMRGEICLCNERLFSDKLSAWHNQQKRVGHICENITPPTKKGGISGLGNGETSGMKNAALSTKKTQKSGKEQGSLQENGQPQIQQKDMPRECVSTESLFPKETKCSQNNTENVLSAKECRNDSTSITAMRVDLSEDSSAMDAILGSGNSGTIQTTSTKHHCICGHKSGRRILVSKSSIFGYGLNFQAVSHVAFVGLSYSFEDFYQALRRSYRFGQTKEVHAYIVQAQTEGAILQNIHRKIEQHKNMQESMKEASKAFTENRIKELNKNTELAKSSAHDWTMYHGDCVRVAKEIPSESVDFTVFSPPFADLFTYSDDLQDMGNTQNLGQFIEHFEFLIAEIARVTVPGREVAVHCVDLLSTKWKHGKIEFQDFSGEIIRAFWRHGFLFHSRICIWKSPVTEMQRTKAHGLLYKTLKADSTDSRVGCADYLLVFRKPGENPRPVMKRPETFPVSLWQEYASPVWMTIDQGRVLNGEVAREHQDERHICPLQLDVIDRAITLWSNPGDLVYSPFAGIGSEGYSALKLDRKFIGSELKKSYYEQACHNLQNARSQLEML